jgi:hypothetical protein
MIPKQAIGIEYSNSVASLEYWKACGYKASRLVDESDLHVVIAIVSLRSTRPILMDSFVRTDHQSIFKSNRYYHRATYSHIRGSKHGNLSDQNEDKTGHETFGKGTPHCTVPVKVTAPRPAGPSHSSAIRQPPVISRLPFAVYRPGASVGRTSMAPNMGIPGIGMVALARTVPTLTRSPLDADRNSIVKGSFW